MALPSHINLLIASGSACVTLILTRCGYRALSRCKRHSHCYRRWHVDDTYMTLALLPIIARTILMSWSFYLNPNTTHDPATADGVIKARHTAEEIDHHRELALKLLLPGRISYALFLWILKLCLLALYSRIMNHLRWGRTVTSILWWTIVLTFIGVVIATLTECRPLYLTWVIAPGDQRDSCSRGVVNLLVMAISNAVTDIALLILPFPLLFKTRMKLKQKLQLSLLFGIGIIVVAITITRIPLILMSSVTQASRSLWASVEIICACIVANTAFLLSLVKDYQNRGVAHDGSNYSQSRSSYKQTTQSTSQVPGRRKDSNTPAAEEVD